MTKDEIIPENFCLGPFLLSIVKILTGFFFRWPKTPENALHIHYIHIPVVGENINKITWDILSSLPFKPLPLIVVFFFFEIYLWVEININAFLYLKINFPAEFMYKIINPSQQNLPDAPRIKWLSPDNFGTCICIYTLSVSESNGRPLSIA